MLPVIVLVYQKNPIKIMINEPSNQLWQKPDANLINVVRLKLWTFKSSNCFSYLCSKERVLLLHYLSGSLEELCINLLNYIFGVGAFLKSLLSFLQAAYKKTQPGR